MWSTPEHGTVQRVVEREGVRVAEVEAVEPLGDDDRVPPVGGEVHVVRDRRPGSARPGLPVRRVDRREAVAGVVRDVERLQVPRRDDVLRQAADRRSARRSCRSSGRSRRPCRSASSARRRAAVRVATAAAQHVRAVVPRRRSCFERTAAMRPVATVGGRAGRARRSSRRCPLAPRPPASRIRSPRPTAARSERATSSRPAAADLPRGGIDRDDPVGRRSPRRRRGRRSRRRACRVAAAAACVVGAGSVPSRRTRARGRVEPEHRGARGAVRERAAGDHEPSRRPRRPPRSGPALGRCATTCAAPPGCQATIVSSQRVPV